MKALPKQTRIAYLQRWLSIAVPQHIERLSLDLDSSEAGAEPERLGSWLRAELEGEPAELASTIDELISNASNELGQRVFGRLIWWTDKETKWTSLELKVDPADGPERLDGTPRNVVVQVQRHSEFAIQSVFERHAKMDEREAKIDARYDHVIEKYDHTLKVVTDLLVQREGRSVSLEDEMARIRDENAALRLELEETRAIAQRTTEAVEETTTELERVKKEGTEDGTMIKLVTEQFQNMAKGGDDKKDKKKTGS